MESLQKCEQLLDYQFSHKEYLDRALTHSSVKSPAKPSNERLEFLGDAILGMVISEHLFRLFPEYDEGDLTRVKSVVVSAAALSRVVRYMQLDDCVVLGKGILKRKTIPRSIMANLFEALIAAIYLDGGIEEARRFVLDNLAGELENVLKDQHAKNYKSILQQLAQRQYATTPVYHVVDESGPDHLKSFEVVAILNGRSFRSAVGNSKKEAEQNAAREALLELEDEETPVE